MIHFTNCVSSCEGEGSCKFSSSPPTDSLSGCRKSFVMRGGHVLEDPVCDNPYEVGKVRARKERHSKISVYPVLIYTFCLFSQKDIPNQLSESCFPHP